MATPHISAEKSDFAKNSIDARRPFTGEIHCGNISDRCRGGQPHRGILGYTGLYKGKKGFLLWQAAWAALPSVSPQP